MASKIVLTITSGEDYTRLAARLKLKTSSYKTNLPNIAEVLGSMGAGMTDFTSGYLTLSTTGRARVKFTGAAANDETLTINGITFTAKTSGAVAANGEFDLSATPGTQATNLAAAINAVADTHISGVVTAEVFTTYVATLTSTGTASNNETFVLNDKTFTAKTSGAVAANAEFDISGTPTTQAANIVAAINAVADTRVNGVVTAFNVAGVVYIYALVNENKGLYLTESLTNATRVDFASSSNAGIVNINANYPSAGILGYTITESMANTTVTAWALDANATSTTL